jgi:hypothetical protein
MPAAPSSLIDPAIGQLLAGAQAVGGGRAGLLAIRPAAAGGGHRARWPGTW